MKKDLAKIQLEITNMLQSYNQIEAICGLYGITNCETEYPKKDAQPT